MPDIICLTEVRASHKKIIDAKLDHYVPESYSKWYSCSKAR